MKKKKPRKIALVGTAPSSIYAPVDDPDWQIWGVGHRADHITRADRWHELHRIEQEFQGKASEEYQELLRDYARDCPLYMFYPEPVGTREVIQYPVKEISEKYGTFFMTSTFSWMLAKAIDELVAEGIDRSNSPYIGLWGVDMEYGSEYREQRAGLRHFCALATFAGIKVTRIVSGGISYDPIPYPFWLDDPLLQKITLRKKIFEKDQEDRGRIVAASRDRISQINAAIDELEKPRDRKKRITELIRERAAMMAQLPKFESDLAETRGVLANLDWTEDFLKP